MNELNDPEAACNSIPTCGQCASYDHWVWCPSENLWAQGDFSGPTVDACYDYYYQSWPLDDGEFGTPDRQQLILSPENAYDQPMTVNRYITPYGQQNDFQVSLSPGVEDALTTSARDTDEILYDLQGSISAINNEINALTNQMQNLSENQGNLAAGEINDEVQSAIAQAVAVDNNDEPEESDNFNSNIDDNGDDLAEMESQLIQTQSEIDQLTQIGT